jgi:hypothetical protein
MTAEKLFWSLAGELRAADSRIGRGLKPGSPPLRDLCRPPG